MTTTTISTKEVFKFLDKSVLHTFKYYSGLGGRNNDRKILPHIQHPIYVLSATTTPTMIEECISDNNEQKHKIYTCNFGKLLFHDISVDDSKKRYEQCQLEDKINRKDIKYEFTYCINFHQEVFLRETIHKLNFNKVEDYCKTTCTIYVKDINTDIVYKAKYDISDSGLCFLRNVVQKDLDMNVDMNVEYYCAPKSHILDVEVITQQPKQSKNYVNIFSDDKTLATLQSVLKSAEWNSVRSYIHMYKTPEYYDILQQVTKFKKKYIYKSMEFIHSLNYTIYSDFNLDTTENRYTVKNVQDLSMFI